MKKILFLITLVLTVSCKIPWYWDCGHDYITFVNDSNILLDVRYEFGYHETNIRQFRRVTFAAPGSGSVDALYNGNRKENWELAFQLYDTVTVQISDSKIADYNVMEEVDENLILQRYYLTLEDVKRLNWILYYPPREVMKDVKMWPPYEEAIKQHENQAE